MPGGILQLVATGIEDTYLTNNPDITFFKTIYRRHTNFSRAELDLHFTNKLDFGKEGYCRLDHFGDLLHRLFMVIELPKIDIAFRTLTVGEVQTLLASPLYQITWETDRPIDAKFNEDDFDEVSKLIDEKVRDLNAENDIIDAILATLTGNGKFVPEIWKRNNPEYSEDNDRDNDGISDAAEKYFDEILLDYFDFDNFNLQYKIIDAHRKDIIDQRQLANSMQIQDMLLQEFISYAISEDNNQFTYNDRNLEFLFNADTANYTITGSLNQLDSGTVFRSGIAGAYGNTPFMHLDAYKIFNNTLIQNPVLISSNADVQNVKAALLTNIRWDLSKNIRQLNNIYNSLVDDARFVFYRRFPVLAIGSGTYDTNSSFSNQSLISTTAPELNDRYTSDFIVEPTVGEPDTVFHPFGQTTSNTVNNFHLTNRDLFRTALFTPYFNDLVNLWSSTDALNNPQSPTLNPPIPPNMYYLNNLWFNMTDDIPNATLHYLSSPGRSSGLSSSTQNNLFNFLVDIKNNVILPTIKPLITRQDNYDDTLRKLDETVKQTKDVTGDIILTGIVRPGIQNSTINDPLFGRITIPEFITNYYLKGLDDFENTLTGNELSNYQNIAKERLINIVNLFTTDISEIPSYDTYINRNQNIYADPLRRINKLANNDTTVFSDVQSSIWNYLFITFVNNYNNLYNDILLGLTYYMDNIGSELSQYLINISNDYLNFPIDQGALFDYFRNNDEYLNKLPIISGTMQFIGQFLTEKITTYLMELAFYDINRPLLDTRLIIVPRARFFYDFFSEVVRFIIDIIETDMQSGGGLIYNHSFHPDPNKDIVLITLRKFEDKSTQFIEPRNNASDITRDMRVVANNFFNSAGIPSMVSNPYDPTKNPNKFNLWNQYVGTFIRSVERDKFNQSGNPNSLFDWLYRDAGEEGTTDGPQELFKFNLQIDTLYNGFALEIDVYNFMADYVIQQSTLKDLPGFLRPTVEETHQLILDYYTTKKEENDQILNNIVGDENILGLKTILERSLNTSALARFAWIRRIGHYLIDQIWLKIDDQQVDKHYGEWLEIWHSLVKRIKKEPGYDILIGDVNDLNAFNTRKKNKYELIIPLQFWFCREIGSSLPLLALHNADIRVHVKLKNFNEVAYFDDFTSFRSRPKLKCKMIGEYIYVENEERENIAKSKLEYLIDTLQYHGDLFITRNSLNDDGFINILTRFKNPCKELVWVLQRLSHIDGSLENRERRWHIYSFDPDGRLNPGKAARIKFNNREREILKEIEFFNFIQPYERHYSTPEIGVNIYTFALDPESLQATGSANFSRIDDTGIEMNLKDEVMTAMETNESIVFRMAIYALSINILRIFSGLGGIVFQQ